MGEFFTTIIQVLPQAASSPIALIAYLFALVAYSTLTWRITRHKNLLASLHKFPPKDRGEILVQEMGRRVPEDITPEQYLTARIHTFYFSAYVVTCVTVLLIILVGVWYAYGRVDVAVDLGPAAARTRNGNLQQAISMTGEANFVKPSELPNADKDEFHSSTEVLYSYEQREGVIEIIPYLPYAEESASGVIRSSSTWGGGLIEWDFPWLNVKVVNNTNKTLVLSSLKTSIASSTLDQKAIIFLLDDAEDGLSFVNEGWGDALSPKFTYDIKPVQTCTQPYELRGQHVSQQANGDLRLEIREQVPETLLATQCESPITGVCIKRRCKDVDRSFIGRFSCIDTSVSSSCEKFTPNMSKLDIVKLAGLQPLYSSVNASPNDIVLKRDCISRRVCVSGKLDFLEEDGKNRTISFQEPVYIPEENFAKSGAMMPVSNEYPLYLEAGRQGYNRTLSLNQEIKPGDSDYFRIQVTTLRSANFKFDMVITDISQKIVWKGKFNLGIIVPRSANLNLENGQVVRVY